MLRMTLLLSCAIFLTLTIGGRDNGQTRAGLREIAADARKTVTPSSATPARILQPVTVAGLDAELPPIGAEAPAEVTQAAFAVNAATPAITYSPAPAMAETDPIVAEQAIIPGLAELSGMVTPASASGGDVRYVSAAAVNVRQGPSTAYGVVGRLTRDDAALVVAEEGNGWALIRIEGDGIEGYVSTRYLTTAPAGN